MEYQSQHTHDYDNLLHEFDLLGGDNGYIEEFYQQFIDDSIKINKVYIYSSLYYYGESEGYKPTTFIFDFTTENDCNGTIVN